MFRPLSRSRTLVRTGFFRSDPAPPASPYYFIDPADPLFSVSNEFRYTDDPTMRNPVLERSNVGMGMLLTNSNVSNLGFTNMLYRKLRDLEVNTLKKFTAVTMSDKQSSVGPIGLRQLLLLSEAHRLGNQDLASRVLVESLRNQADLALVVADYFKPIVTLLNAKDSGIGLAALGNTSGCFKNSNMQFDLVNYGFVPIGGLSFALARTPWSIGEFLALTSRTIRGQDIIYCGLAKKWISPEAFGFMEVTSEHKLDVSERDANALLEEHYLSPPSDWSLKPFISTINEAFGSDHFEDVIRSLQRVSASASDPKLAAFASECLARMEAADPLSLRLTFKLIKRARRHIASIKEELLLEQGEETAARIQKRPRLMQEHVMKPALIQTLRDELRVASRLVPMDEFRKRVHAHIVGTEVRSSGLKSVSISIDDFFSPIVNDYAYAERTDFPLSAHPKLRKFHPDFNPKTGLDHDPQFMAREVHRWSDTYLKEEIEELRCSVTGMSRDQLRANTDLRWD